MAGMVGCYQFYNFDTFNDLLNRDLQNVVTLLGLFAAAALEFCCH